MTRSRVIVGGGIVGLAVLTVFLLFEGVSAVGTAQIVGYQRTGDARKIVVVVGVSLLDELAEREVREDARSVTVKVHTRSSGGSAPAILINLCPSRSRCTRRSARARCSTAPEIT